MIKPNRICVSELRQLMRLDETTGLLYWLPRSEEYFETSLRCRQWNTRYAWKEAFTSFCRKGYKQGTMLSQPYKAHRLVYALFYNVDPGNFEIDHINGNRSDNRPTNLRLVTSQGNNLNQCLHKTNQSGVKGVSFCKQEKKWRSHIGVDGRDISLGRFSYFEDAVRARMIAELKHGFQSRPARTLFRR